MTSASRSGILFFHSDLNIRTWFLPPPHTHTHTQPRTFTRDAVYGAAGSLVTASGTRAFGTTVKISASRWDDADSGITVERGRGREKKKKRKQKRRCYTHLDRATFTGSASAYPASPGTPVCFSFLFFVALRERAARHSELLPGGGRGGRSNAWSSLYVVVVEPAVKKDSAIMASVSYQIANLLEKVINGAGDIGNDSERGNVICRSRTKSYFAMVSFFLAT